METKKAYMLTGHIILWAFAAFSLLFIFRADVVLGQFKGDNLPSYSIYNDKALFIVYHAWCVIIPMVCSYAIWKRHKMLFYITLLLTFLLMFYPWFTAG
jgi:hypothetical protein